MLPADHPTLPGVFDAGFDAMYADFRDNAVFEMRLGFRLALFVAIWIAPLLIGRVGPISRLARPERVAALNALYESRFNAMRQMVVILKVTICLAYGADPAVRRAIGFRASAGTS